MNHFYNEQTGIWQVYIGEVTGSGRTLEEAVADVKALAATVAA